MTLKEKKLILDDENKSGSDTRASIGQILMIERINQKLSQKNIAEQLHLKLSVIESLEDNEPIAGLPATYLRGYQRSYARLLGLNETQVMGEDNFINLGALREESLQSINLPMDVKGSHWGRLLMAVFLACIAAAAFILWPWTQNKSHKTISNIQSPESQVANTEQASTNKTFSDVEVIAKSKVVSSKAGAELIDETLDADKTQIIKNINQSIAIKNTTTQTPYMLTKPAISPLENMDLDIAGDRKTQAINSEQKIMFISNGESWLEVVDDAQTKVYSGILRLDRVLLKGKLPMKVKVGNMQVIRIAYEDGVAQKVGIFNDSQKIAQFIVDLDENGSLHFLPN